MDSNRGYAIRFRYLDIALSDAEQKDFFSAWADEINSAIGSGLKGIDQTTKRIQFLLESQLLLNSLGTIVKLDSPIWDICKGHFFFQTMLTLRMHSDGLMSLTYGGGTGEILETLDQWEAGGKQHTKNWQIGFGYSSLLPETPQHRRYSEGVKNLERPKNAKQDQSMEYIRTSKSTGILEVDRPHLIFRTLSEPFLDRFQPTCKLIDLDGCMILFDCSKEISDHVEEIIIVAGGYELLKITKVDLRPHEGTFDRLKVPAESRLEKDSHVWTTIRPSNSSSFFSIDLMSNTPRRYDW